MMAVIGMICALNRLTHGAGAELKQIEDHRRVGHFAREERPFDPRHLGT